MAYIMANILFLLALVFVGLVILACLLFVAGLLLAIFATLCVAIYGFFKPSSKPSHT